MLLLLMMVAAPCSGAESDYISRSGPDVTVFCTPGQAGAANAVIAALPRLKDELASRIGWHLRGHIRIWLLDDEGLFQRMMGRPFFSAFVIPESGVMVIDGTKMHGGALTLESTLKHELCHLLLHQHIAPPHLPRWLDEGVAQWYSDGFSELLNESRGDALRQAALSGDLPPLHRLDHYFSQDQRSVRLAYEASRSFVDFVVLRYGVDGLLRLLEALKQGASPEAAVPEALGDGFRALEQGWRESIESRRAWWAVAARHLYDILFFTAALITIIAFSRLVIRRRRQADTDEDSDETGAPWR